MKLRLKERKISGRESTIAIISVRGVYRASCLISCLRQTSCNQTFCLSLSLEM